MRSNPGVGMTPPNVPLTPYPWSSVMISRMLGAPLGGTTFGGHHVFDSVASSLITPPNLGGGGGSCLPSMVIVALGNPSVPLICWAYAPDEGIAPRRTLNDSIAAAFMISFLLESAVSIRASTDARKAIAVLSLSLFRVRAA